MPKPEAARPHPLAGRQPAALRSLFRAGRYTGATTGLAPGRLQCNLVVLPHRAAQAFAAYCAANPAPCPLLYMGAPGDPMLDALGADIDIRTDLPAYLVHRDGNSGPAVPDILDLWRADSVALLLGCSLSFEEALVAAGVRLRHLERGGDIAAFRTSIKTTPAPPFSGPLVVSMRAVAAADAGRAGAITTRFTHAHGAPLHTGDPAALGIADVERPDWGEPPTIQAGEVPMFWACGVTSHLALLNARLPLAITHAPGAMLITDLAADKPPEPISSS
ncbi:MAG: putative hydro-lyase [Proteobacteria bacterium]|nr:putative hydro-lyase [Pseudomonadota bacterium]MDA1059898.1 putative hydro-lyase [Pseudomonadota bacterium]